MSTPQYAASDYQVAFKNILPSGDAWPDDINAVTNLTLAGLQPVYERTTARANDLLREVVPSSTLELLPEWEATYGLPDPCAGLSPTIEARRAQVVARAGATGGQDIPYLIRFAANLGYPITITQFTPSRFPFRLGQPFGGEAWAHAWQVNALTFTIERFTLGTSSLGEPFASWGNSVLQCEMQRIAPAHTIVNFFYS